MYLNIITVKKPFDKKAIYLLRLLIKNKFVIKDFIKYYSYSSVINFNKFCYEKYI